MTKKKTTIKKKPYDIALSPDMAEDEFEYIRTYSIEKKYHKVKIPKNGKVKK